MYNIIVCVFYLYIKLSVVGTIVGYPGANDLFCHTLHVTWEGCPDIIMSVVGHYYIGKVVVTIFNVVQHVYQRISNKNRRQGNSPGDQSQHDDDIDHVISNEETITNEATDSVNVVDNDDVNDDHAVTCHDDDRVNNDDVAISNSEVTSSNNVDVAVSNNTEATTSNNNDVAVSNSDVCNDSVAISNNDVTTEDMWDKREEKYCAKISTLTRSIELHHIREQELLNSLTELQNAYKSLQESSSQKIDAITSEREQYKMERDELQRKIDSATDVTLLSSRANVSPPLAPHSNTWQHINHRDIKVMYCSTC